MKIEVRIMVLVLAALCMSMANGADIDAVPARDTLTLSEGSNDMNLSGVTVRMIKSYVGTLNAHSYDSFTSFVLPRKGGDPWLHIIVDAPSNSCSEFRTVESADSTVQAITVYRDRGALLVVQATKIGFDAPDLYFKKTHVKFTVYKFNEDLDFPRFKQKKSFESRLTYLNASDALTGEFFAH